MSKSIKDSGDKCLNWTMACLALLKDVENHAAVHIQRVVWNPLAFEIKGLQTRLSRLFLWASVCGRSVEWASVILCWTISNWAVWMVRMSAVGCSWFKVMRLTVLTFSSCRFFSFLFFHVPPLPLSLKLNHFLISGTDLSSDSKGLKKKKYIKILPYFIHLIYCICMNNIPLCYYSSKVFLIHNYVCVCKYHHNVWDVNKCDKKNFKYCLTQKVWEWSSIFRQKGAKWSRRFTNESMHVSGFINMELYEFKQFNGKDKRHSAAFKISPVLWKSSNVSRNSWREN